MKKQFNRMRQLANQTVGRWVFVLTTRIVASECHTFILWQADAAVAARNLSIFRVVL